jgi:hypothetical protein
MKKTNKPSNPLKVFNDNRAMAYKKAGGAMKDFKKSLPKAQTGKSVKPLTLKDKEGYQWNIDTTGYAKGVKNFYPYEKPYPGVKGVLTKAEMDKVMSNVGKAVGTAKGPGALAKAAANATKSKKAKGGSVKSRKK